MKSLKSKLILGISLFIVILLSITAILQIKEKEKEFANDILVNARSYAELTAGRLVEDYKLYLVPNSFVYFNRSVQETLARNTDVSSIQIISFNGEIVFDSAVDRDSKYQGEARMVKDPVLLQQIQTKNLSIKPVNQDKAIFYKKSEDSAKEVSYLPVDFNEESIKDLSSTEKISYMVAAGDNKYAVLYKISYDALQARIQSTEMRILLLAVLGVSLGILLAIIFGSTITKPIAVLKRGAEVLATGDLTHRVVVKTKDEIFDLAQSFNKMAADLQESTKALVYKERVGKELELATQIQKQLIPKKIPKIKGLDISAGIIPAEEIGGDCYDFIQPNEDTLRFYLGDVTGHGVPSGIIVSIANALFYTFADRGDLPEILNDVNEVLKVKTTPNMFLTLVLMQWLAEEQKFSYVSAGHEQIIHYKAAENEVVLLPSGGLALGMIKDISKLLKVRDVELAKDDVLIIYSDGIPEAWSSPSEMYGMDRLKKIAMDYGKFPSALAIRNAVLADVYLFRQGYKQMDDITCIIVKKS